jgi:hypothetical protein
MATMTAATLTTIHPYDVLECRTKGHDSMGRGADPRLDGVTLATSTAVMTVRKLVAVVFRLRRRGVARVPITPEFGVRVTLREGDKLVHRNASGEVEVKTITRGGERGV